MKRLLIAMFCCIMLFVTLGASAEASTSGAERAVDREITFDYGYGRHQAWSSCDSAGRNRYTCKITVIDRDAFRYGVGKGAARVTQRGSRYSVSYRIYW